MSNPQIVRAIKLCAIFCFIGWAVFYSLSMTINTPTFHLDGAFQTASGLYRLDAGQMPGRDFFPYLGIGPLFLLFPLFKLLGSNLSASSFAAQFMVLLAGATAVSVLWHLTFKPNKKTNSILAGFFIFFGSLATLTTLNISIPEWLQFGITPGNSIKPIRSFLPYLAAGFLLIHKPKNPISKYIARGAFCGAMLTWSNDFSITTAILFSILMIPLATYEKNVSVKTILSYTAALFISSTLLYFTTTAGHPIALIKYNFIDVANDQWWYFASYGEAVRIYNFSQLTRLFTEENYLPLAVLILLSIYAAFRKSPEAALNAWIGTALFAGGAVASIGGHLGGGYMAPFYFWGAWVLIITLAHIASRAIRNPKESICAIGALILSIAAILNSAATYQSSSNIAKSNPNLFFSPELGGYLGLQWKDYISMAIESKESVVIEEYWGLWSATRKSFSSWPVDSSIHALGHTREKAAEQIKFANIVTSTKNSLSNEWQSWGLSQNYWFYKELFENFTPYASSPFTVIWKRKPSGSVLQESTCNYKNDPIGEITISNEKKGFHEVTMEYEFRGAGRFLTMIKNNISFVAGANGYVSFNPKGNKVTFPAYLNEKSTPLDVRIIGYAPSQLFIKSCTAKFITDNDDEVTRTPTASR